METTNGFWELLGYGDLPAVTVVEKIFAICWMMTGVFVYSFLIGTFSNIFTKMDQSKENMRKNLHMLKRFNESYKLPRRLFLKSKQIIRAGYELAPTNYIGFLDDLQIDLKMEVRYYIYKSLVEGVDYFKEKPHGFISKIGPFLKPIVVQNGDYVYTKDDLAEESKLHSTSTESHETEPG